MSKSMQNFMLGAVIGAAAGAAAGILLAPEEGSKTGKELKKKLDQYMQILESVVEETVEKGRDILPEKTVAFTKKLQDEAEERIARIRQQLHNKVEHHANVTASTASEDIKVVIHDSEEAELPIRKEKKRNLFRGV